MEYLFNLLRKVSFFWVPIHACVISTFFSITELADAFGMTALFAQA